MRNLQLNYDHVALQLLNVAFGLYVYHLDLLGITITDVAKKPVFNSQKDVAS
jgi:hypothetical protein